MSDNPYQSGRAQRLQKPQLLLVSVKTLAIGAAIALYTAGVAIYFYDKGWNDCIAASGYSLDPNRDWVLP